MLASVASPRSRYRPSSGKLSDSNMERDYSPDPVPGAPIWLDHFSSSKVVKPSVFAEVPSDHRPESRVRSLRPPSEEWSSPASSPKCRLPITDHPSEGARPTVRVRELGTVRLASPPTINFHRPIKPPGSDPPPPSPKDLNARSLASRREPTESVPPQLRQALQLLVGLGLCPEPCSWRTLWFHFTFPSSLPVRGPTSARTALGRR